MNKKITSVILTVVFLLTSFCSTAVFAEKSPVRVEITGDTETEPGKNVTLYVNVDIEAGADIQGVQVDFDYSENFPKTDNKNFSIDKNTTGWSDVGVTTKNLLAVGDVCKNDSEISAKIVFKVPSAAKDGTKYVFEISDAIGADAEKEVLADISKKEWTVKVEDSSSGGGSGGGGGGSGGGGGGSVGGSAGVSTIGGNVGTGNGSAAVSTGWTNPFNDVGQDDWFYNSVKYVFENKLMNGTSSYEFAPDVTLTRAMLVTILYRNEGEPAIDSGATFADVISGAYYEKAVSWAQKTGIVNGYSETEFAPDENIIREQIAAIMHRYAKYKGYDTSMNENTDISSYADYSRISDYAIPAVKYAVGSGLIKGKTNSTINPGDNATRAETATILQRFIESNN